MSTRSTVIYINDEEHIYFDMANSFKTKYKDYANELTFEFSKKNIRIDTNDENNLCFSLDKNSEMYMMFAKLFNENTQLLRDIQKELDSER